MKNTNTHTMSSLRPLSAWALALGLFASCSASESHGSMEDEHAPAEEHMDEDGHDGGEHGDEEGRRGEHVELDAGQLKASNLNTAQVVNGEIAEYISLPAVVAQNSDTTTHINPKVPGLVRSIKIKLGDHVEPGDLLCTIDSVELGSSAADLLLARALVDAATETLTKEEALFEQRIDTTSEVLAKAVEVNRTIHAREQDLQSQGVSTIRPLLEAEKELLVSELQKDLQLNNLRVEKATRILALEVNLREQRILAEGAENRLRALGIPEDEIQGTDESSQLLAGTYDIRATRAGIVTARHISHGEYVDAATKLFSIEDLSKIWVIASAFEQQLPLVRTGQPALVTLNSFPEQSFEAFVSLVEFNADPETRAIGVRVELSNDALEEWRERFPMRPGMFGNVRLETQRRQAALIIPESAVVHDDAGESVFVQLEEGVFESRKVRLAKGTGMRVEVLSGLKLGERVVTVGTFLLKSVARQEQLGGGHSH